MNGSTGSATTASKGRLDVAIAPAGSDGRGGMIPRSRWCGRQLPAPVLARRLFIALPAGHRAGKAVDVAPVKSKALQGLRRQADRHGPSPT